MSEDYSQYAHQVQTAIGFNPNRKFLEPKHMRTGIDMTKADMKGLALLLIDKGIFTKEEYIAAITQSAKEEADFQRNDLAKEMGMSPDTINLG